MVSLATVAPVGEVMDTSMKAIPVDIPDHEVAMEFEHHDLVTAPVVDAGAGDHIVFTPIGDATLKNVAELKAPGYELAIDFQGLVKSAFVARRSGAPVLGPLDRTSGSATVASHEIAAVEPGRGARARHQGLRVLRIGVGELVGGVTLPPGLSLVGGFDSGFEPEDCEPWSRESTANWAIMSRVPGEQGASHKELFLSSFS